MIVVVPAGHGTATSPGVGNLAAALDKAIAEGVDSALEVAIKRIAAIKLELAMVGFTASLVSVTRLEVRPFNFDPQLSIDVHAGSLAGPGTVVTEGS